VRVPSSWFFSTVHWPRRQVIIVPQYRPYQPHFRAPRDYYDGFRDAPAWRHDMRHRRGLVYRHEQHRRHPARPPQIGTPRPPAVPQRPSILRDTPGGSERRTGPQAHQFGHSNPRLDSSDRQVPINPRAGERFGSPRAGDRARDAERRPYDVRPPAAPSRRDARDSDSRRSDAPRATSRGESSRGSGAAPRQQQRDSVLR
jgi:hypothetical protein